MRKHVAPEYTQRPPRPPSVWLALRLFIATVSLGPFVYEGTLILYARWVKVFGYRPAVRTPVLDGVGRHLRSSYSSLMDQFRRVPWHPPAVIVVGVACCVACMVLLRGRGSRIQ